MFAMFTFLKFTNEYVNMPSILHVFGRQRSLQKFEPIHLVDKESVCWKRENADLLVALEEKSGDLQSHYDSFLWGP